MDEPSITVLGVYDLPFDEKSVKKQADLLYGTAKGSARRETAERRVREQFLSTVLVEVLVLNRDHRFQAGDFAQPKVGVPRSSWQVAWAEAYLSVDGKSRLKAVWPNPPAKDDFRVGFFIHYWDFRTPLLSSYGELQCPLPMAMPARLLRLVPYKLLD